ncbi:MAG: hypothetical protein ACLTTP_00240 [Alistipes ihumii]
MIKFFLFIKRFTCLAFVVLEAFAPHYYANSTSYRKLDHRLQLRGGRLNCRASAAISASWENAALNAELAELRNWPTDCFRPRRAIPC